MFLEMKLYRYLSLDRFLSSFKKIQDSWLFEIRINSPQYFQDPWEGLGNGLVGYLSALSEGKKYLDLSRESGYEGGHLESIIGSFMPLMGNQYKNYSKELIEALRFSNEHLTSCWFMGSEENERSESFAMWDLYAANNGILIGYDLGVINQALMDSDLDFEKGRVCYEDFLSIKFDQNLHLDVKSLLLKDLSYDHEKEYRFIIENRRSKLFENVILPLPEEIIANPKLSGRSVASLRKAIDDYGLKMNQSELSTDISRRELIEYLNTEMGLK
jgi:hypothetical protein